MSMLLTSSLGLNAFFKKKLYAAENLRVERTSGATNQHTTYIIHIQSTFSPNQIHFWKCAQARNIFS